MNDLIINGIDHSAFDLDWAKRGGWCIVRGEVCKLISKATYISSDTDTLFVRAIAERMATREECAVAGIEYIEPMQAEIDSLEAQLAEARKDSERLDWIISQSEVIVVGANTSEINYVDAYFIDATVKKLAYGNNPREAIDNAMARPIEHGDKPNKVRRTSRTRI